MPENFGREFRENPTRRIMRSRYEMCFSKGEKLPKLWTGAVIDIQPSTERWKKKNDFMKACNFVRTMTGRCLFIYTWKLHERTARFVGLYQPEYEMETWF